MPAVYFLKSTTNDGAPKLTSLPRMPTAADLVADVATVGSIIASPPKMVTLNGRLAALTALMRSGRVTGFGFAVWGLAGLGREARRGREGRPANCAPRGHAHLRPAAACCWQ